MMKYQTKVSVLPVMAEASNQSVMISQMLFGETCEVTGKELNFAHIRTDFDGTEGFVDFQCLEPETETEKTVITVPYQSVEMQQGAVLLSIGSEIPKEKITETGERSNIADLALKFLNVPFMQGGRSFFGTDAAAFVQLIFKVTGYKLPRTVTEQAEHGKVLDFLGESADGDLAFFEDEDGQINHVGVVLNSSEVVHCFGKVRKDQLDTAGIYNRDLKKHTHKLRFIRRIEVKTG